MSNWLSVSLLILAVSLSPRVLLAEDEPKSKTEKQLAEAEAENNLEEQRVTRSVRKLLEEQRRLTLESELVELRRELGVAKLQAAKEKIELEQTIAELEGKKATATLSLEKLKSELQAESLEYQGKIALQKLKQEAERLTLTNDQAEQKVRKKELALQDKQTEYDAETAQLDVQLKKLELARTKAEDDLATLQAQLDLGDKERALKKRVDRAAPHTVKAFQRGVLTVTERRIAMNGPIIKGTADYVTQRIHFFNNKSGDAPIFIIIDRCPGGSVMEGYRIVKAIEASRAPIHVVVKSFAASMAAVILTMAPESYAYPNAIILHHQPSSASIGNLTQQTEQMRMFKEWARRLHTPVAKKMGLSLDTFYKKMYERNSFGDWEEFADEAQRLKWVKHIVHEVREQGTDLMPTGEAPQPSLWFLEAKPKPPRGVRLPRPEAFDYYFIYNRPGLYSWAP